MKKHLSTIVLILVFLVGLAVLLYPSVSNYVNERTQSYAIANYEEKLLQMDKADFDDYFEKAENYNQKLHDSAMGFYDPSSVLGYNESLNIDGMGTMGYVTIPKIGVNLPLYHGIEESVLQHAAGHIEGTSLPIGGSSRHAVISAHRGLPSAKLFTDLDKLEVGDRFSITVLDRIFTYEVDAIFIVEPEDTSHLLVSEGEDYCTLLTCTPYGINTHRLLVRGTRVEEEHTQRDIYIASDAFKIDPLVATPLVAIPFLVLLLIYLLVRYRKKRK